MNRFDVDYYLRTSDFDMNSRIHPAAVLDLFQEVAGGHATLLGCSFAQMLAKNLLWMVTRVRFSMVKMPEKNYGFINNDRNKKQIAYQEHGQSGHLHDQ